MPCCIRLAGAAGQGVETAVAVLGRALTRGGSWVSTHAEVESRVRGGVNWFQVVADAAPVGFVLRRVDLLLALTAEAAAAGLEALAPDGRLVAPPSVDDPRRLPLDLDDLASRAGSTAVVGTAAAAAAGALLGLDPALIEAVVAERHGARDDAVLAQNLAACRLAAAAVGALPAGAANPWVGLAAVGVPSRLFLYGHEALSLGALAGGVTFFAAYPMSPATGCFTDLANWSAEAGAVTVQAEDEVAAINMVAGASYAGARAMTATSGGGLCLMTEGISLLGQIEAPAVLVVAQRPGPATGMATRTAQEDLLMVVHAGHGFVPRVVVAPSDVGSCFAWGARAFDLAERWQVPVFVMTDQLLQDGAAAVAQPDLAALPAERLRLTRCQLEAAPSYRRSADAPSGVPPLAAPGQSRHLVAVDSHTHDEQGHLTESSAGATAWADRQRRKAAALAALAEPPLLDGDPDGATLLVAWGSAAGTARRAAAVARERGRPVAVAVLEWLWPAPGQALAELMGRAARTVAVDASVGRVFASYLLLASGRRPDAVLDRVDGRPFTVEELVERLEGGEAL